MYLIHISTKMIKYSGLICIESYYDTYKIDKTLFKVKEE